ncbi:dihydrolipoamide acyltransferase [Thermus sp.]|uniref:dihydrolipoamide acyltransferase n=1 Tax=Thermus sp. TaxID=275 RepID=UPI00307D0A78
MPEEELRRAQEVLGREGVDLSEVLPTRPPTVEIREEELDLEPILLDDLEDLALEEEPPMAPPEPEPTLEEWGEELLAQAAHEVREEVDLPTEAPLPEEAPAPLVEEAPSEALLEELEDLGSLEEGLEALVQEPQEVAPAFGVVAPPPSAAAPVLRVFRRRLDPGALEAAQRAFAQAFGVPETPMPFLLKAAEKALAELELPLRPLMGLLEGERPLGLRPKGPFLALFRGEGEEAGEGLLCFAGAEEVHTGRPSLFLLPEGLLALSGVEEGVARRLLERVALYLEHPVLLLA